MNSHRLTAFVSLFLSFSAVGAEPNLSFDISSDRADGFYRVGEPATFTVTVKDAKSGSLARSGDIVWHLDNFGTQKIASGTNSLAAANPFSVAGSRTTDGFLRLTVTCGADRRVWSVGYDVEKIRQTAPRPDDFDAYWTGERARLAREVPLDPRVVRDERLSTYNAQPVGLHISDSQGDDDHLSPGAGKVDFASLRTLAADARHLVFEPNACVAEAELRRGIAFLKKTWEI